MSGMLGIEKEKFRETAKNVDVIGKNIDVIAKEIVLLSRKMCESYDTSFSSLFKYKSNCFEVNFDLLYTILYGYKREMDSIIKYYENTERVINSNYN